MSADRLVTQHMAWARTIARRYQGLGLSLEDLFGAAYLGLCVAATKYDPDNHAEAPFTALAVLWIKRHIAEAIAASSIGPRRIIRARPKVAEAQARLIAGGNPRPTVEEIAEASGLDPALVREVLATVPCETAVECFGLEGPELADDQVTEALAECTELGQRILSLVNGLGGEEPMSLSEVARHLGITRGQARVEHDRACLKIAQEFRRRGWTEESWAAAIAG